MASDIRSSNRASRAKIPSASGVAKFESGVVGTVVEFAIKNGYRHIDCAKVYNNEKEATCGIHCIGRGNYFTEVNVGGSKYALGDAQVARLSDFGRKRYHFLY
ncbi:hypothetical protein K2173_008898 [Erythroxylum novogranatense]|uniref:NADP-dependent oxidoreductase domain-containing protein n=1 Tax=Erythroxylum novogranatense TaxID=1862640 RepID=A0AAV8S4J6_9ROSI|nr:hypothetical protein K2173_008898 [Erythroxylum novogranatense]